MRRRISVMVVLLTVLLVGAPATAQAETTSGTCKVGVVLPARLVMTSVTTPYGVRLTGDTTCFSYVPWDLSQGLISTGQVLQFWAPNTSGFFSYYGLPATVHALPRQGAYSSVQYTDPATGSVGTYMVQQSGSNTMTAKWDSRIAWRTPKQTGSLLRLKASVAALSTATRYTGNYTAWIGAKVRFQHRTGTTWRTVVTARTDQQGTARAAVAFQPGRWRAVSADSATTWGRTTGTHLLKDQPRHHHGG